MTKVHSPETGDPVWATHDDHALHLHRDKLASLSASERDFVYELFDHIGHAADDVLLSTLREWWEQHPATAIVVAGYWGLQVRRASEALGLLATGQKGRSVLTGIAVLTVASPIALCLGFHGGLHDAIAVSSWFTLLPLGLLLYSWAQRTRALTVKGCELAGGYEALGRYMATFGRLEEKPAEAVVLWDEPREQATLLVARGGLRPADLPFGRRCGSLEGLRATKPAAREGDDGHRHGDLDAGCRPPRFLRRLIQLMETAFELE